MFPYPELDRYCADIIRDQFLFCASGTWDKLRIENAPHLPLGGLTPDERRLLLEGLKSRLKLGDDEHAVVRAQLSHHPDFADLLPRTEPSGVLIAGVAGDVGHVLGTRCYLLKPAKKDVRQFITVPKAPLSNELKPTLHSALAILDGDLPWLAQSSPWRRLFSDENLNAGELALAGMSLNAAAAVALPGLLPDSFAIALMAAATSAFLPVWLTSRLTDSPAAEAGLPEHQFLREVKRILETYHVVVVLCPHPPAELDNVEQLLHTAHGRSATAGLAINLILTAAEMAKAKLPASRTSELVHRMTRSARLFGVLGAIHCPRIFAAECEGLKKAALKPLVTALDSTTNSTVSSVFDTILDEDYRRHPSLRMSSRTRPSARLPSALAAITFSFAPSLAGIYFKAPDLRLPHITVSGDHIDFEAHCLALPGWKARIDSKEFPDQATFVLSYGTCQKTLVFLVPDGVAPDRASHALKNADLVVTSGTREWRYPLAWYRK